MTEIRRRCTLWQNSKFIHLCLAKWNVFQGREACFSYWCGGGGAMSSCWELGPYVVFIFLSCYKFFLSISFSLPFSRCLSPFFSLFIFVGFKFYINFFEWLATPLFPFSLIPFKIFQTVFLSFHIIFIFVTLHRSFLCSSSGWNIF